MKFLTFDTSLNKTYITLYEDEILLDSRVRESNEEKYHSAYLISEIVDILKKNSITMQDIKAIGTNIGPGSFTGIRVCMTIARVMAQQLEVKLIGISSLQILSKLNKTDKNSLILMDARKNKAYCGIFSNDGEIIKPPESIDIDEAINLAKGDYFIICDKNMHKFLSEQKIESLNYEDGDYALGEALAHLVYKNISDSKEDFHWAKLKPLYIQPPSISKPKAG